MGVRLAVPGRETRHSTRIGVCTRYGAVQSWPTQQMDRDGRGGPSGEQVLPADEPDRGQRQHGAAPPACDSVCVFPVPSVSNFAGRPGSCTSVHRRVPGWQDAGPRRADVRPAEWPRAVAGAGDGAAGLRCHGRAVQGDVHTRTRCEGCGGDGSRPGARGDGVGGVNPHHLHDATLPCEGGVRAATSAPAAARAPLQSRLQA